MSDSVSDAAVPPPLDVTAPLVSGEGIDDTAIMNALRGVIDPELAETVGVPLLASVPLDASVAAAGDAGFPVAFGEPGNPAAAVFRELAETIVEDVAPPVKIADCSLRGALTRAGADLDAARARALAR